MKACLFTNQMFCIENYSTISMYYQQNEKFRGIVENSTKIKITKIAKNCKSFARLVKYLSMFCPNLKKKNFSNPYIIYQEKEDLSCGPKYSKMLLNELKADHQNNLFCISQMKKKDLYFSLTLAKQQLDQLCTNFKMLLPN